MNTRGFEQSLLRAAAFVAVGLAAAPAWADPVLQNASVRSDATVQVPVSAAVRERAHIHVIDSAGYEQQKQMAATAPQSSVAGEASVSIPGENLSTDPLVTVVRKWEGLRGMAGAPTDSTSAIGRTRFIELINSNFGIFDRSSTVPMSTGTLDQMLGCVFCGDAIQTDPQVIWDAGTNRFYAVYLEVSELGNSLLIAFSTTASPSSASDWCRYSLSFGDSIPDYPKLGDTSDFILIGTNGFTGDPGSYTGSSVSWVTKPHAGTTCPDASTFRFGTVKLPDVFTPVPANQIDKSSTGWIVAVPLVAPSDKLKLLKVTKAADGSAVIPTTATDLSVPAFTFPFEAPQKSSRFFLDTLDGRNTQAVSAIDPAHGRVGLWTQHTVGGGAGAEVRWYELDPEHSSVFQSGVISHPSLYLFNAAISPDRVRAGSDARFGSNMVISFNSSSTTTNPALLVASKIGTGRVSQVTQIGTSSGAENTFECSENGDTCRWGDYAAGTPDPKAPLDAVTGRVWGTSMLAVPLAAYDDAAWRTRNFVVKP
ncbi:MAG TPA: hypothetical protein VGK20_18165 [Candidatus Binatia bacterium]|jgi:hypothetical protein